LNAAERWCGRHRRWILAGILLASVAIRIAHFVEIGRSPVVLHHHWAQSDMNTYHRWSREIAGGDWLTDRSFHPVHRWHVLVATSFFRQYPDQRGNIGTDDADGDREAAVRLWEAWTGGKRFHAEPMYAYLGGLTHVLTGPDVRWILAWQTVLGVFGLLLIFSVARRIFGDLVAGVAALFGLLCGPLLFYEMVLLRTTLITVTGLGLTWLILWSESRGGRRRWLLTGVAFGCAILVKSVFAVMFVGLLALTAWHHRGDRKALLRSIPVLLLGCLAGLTPLIVRNLTVGAPPLALSSVNATAFTMSNGKNYDPRINRMDPNEIARIMGRTGGRFLPSVVETLKSHESPASYVGFVWRKFAATWHGYEMPNNASFYYHRLYSRTLRLLPVTFFVLSPLALVGLGLALSRRRIGWPLYLLTSTHLLVMLIALVQSRYRMPLVVALLPFAALTVVRCAESLQARRMKQAVTIVALVALLGVWTSQRLPPEVKVIRDADCTALLRWHLQEHGLAEAREYLTTVLEVAPDSVGTLLSLGDVERHDANPELAVAHYNAALELDPDNRYAREQLEALAGQPELSRTPPS